MTQLDDIHSHKEKLHNTCKIKVNQDADTLIALIDELAERATNIQGHGLAMFMQTRQEFIGKVEQLRKEYTILLSPEVSSIFLCS